MKVISLLQPWASLVVFNFKRIETRSWNTKYRGPLLIHASAGKFKPSQLPMDLVGHLANVGLWDYEFPYGAIIGLVNLNDTVKTEEVAFFLKAIFSKSLCDFHNSGVKDWDQETAFGDFSPGRFGWLLSDPIQFTEPIPAKGKLGLWEYNI